MEFPPPEVPPPDSLQLLYTTVIDLMYSARVPPVKEITISPEDVPVPFAADTVVHFAVDVDARYVCPSTVMLTLCALL